MSTLILLQLMYLWGLAQVETRKFPSSDVEDHLLKFISLTSYRRWSLSTAGTPHGWPLWPGWLRIFSESREAAENIHYRGIHSSIGLEVSPGHPKPKEILENESFPWVIQPNKGNYSLAPHRCLYWKKEIKGIVKQSDLITKYTWPVFLHEFSQLRVEKARRNISNLQMKKINASVRHCWDLTQEIFFFFF